MNKLEMIQKLVDDLIETRDAIPELNRGSWRQFDGIEWFSTGHSVREKILAGIPLTFNDGFHYGYDICLALIGEWLGSSEEELMIELSLGDKNGTDIHSEIVE